MKLESAKKKKTSYPDIYGFSKTVLIPGILGTAMILGGCSSGTEKEGKSTSDSVENKGATEKKVEKISDRDGDGIPDDKDACPDQAAKNSSNGCPPPRLSGIARRPELDDMHIIKPKTEKDGMKSDEKKPKPPIRLKGKRKLPVSPVK
ncbi:MAG: hypothetical protein JXR95_00595 [Deltaproteobacteria bacterium]|nr:hypothetical protein [Deltaproteobacteria bacterium]